MTGQASDLYNYIAIINAAQLTWTPDGALQAIYTNVNNNQASVIVPKETLKDIKILGMTPEKDKNEDLRQALQKIATKEKPFNVLQDMLNQKQSLTYDRNTQQLLIGFFKIPLKELKELRAQKATDNSPLHKIQTAITNAIDTTNKTPISQPQVLPSHDPNPKNPSQKSQKKNTAKKSFSRRPPKIDTEILVAMSMAVIVIGGGFAHLIPMWQKQDAERQARQEKFQETATKLAQSTVNKELQQAQDRAIEELLKIQRNPQGEGALELRLQEKIETTRQRENPYKYYYPNSDFFDPQPFITNTVVIPDGTKRCLNDLVHPKPGQIQLHPKPGQIMQITGRSVHGALIYGQLSDLEDEATLTLRSNQFFRTKPPKDTSLEKNTSFLTDTSMEDADYTEHYKKQGISTDDNLNFKKGNFFQVVTPYLGSEKCEKTATTEAEEGARIITLLYNLETGERFVVLGNQDHHDMKQIISNPTQAKQDLATHLANQVIESDLQKEVDEFALGLVCSASQTTKAVLYGQSVEEIIKQCPALMILEKEKEK